MVSCSKKNEAQPVVPEVIVPMPEPPAEPVVFQPLVDIQSAKKITLTTATIVAKVIPNDTATTISFDYKILGGDWITKMMLLKYSGKDSVTVTFDLSDLKPQTDYSYRVKATNRIHSSTSPESYFTTFAVADYDGNFYHIVTIGTQTFTKENFRGTHYANGDPIANVTDATTWSQLTTGAYCWYDNDFKIGKVYGGLYNFYVGADSRGLIIGWHVPTVEEWIHLINDLGGYLFSGPKIMETGLIHWNSTRRLATNISGFTALPWGDFGISKLTNKFEFMDLGTSAAFLASSDLGSLANAAFIDASVCVFNPCLLFEKCSSFSIRLLRNK